jgi:hypothetical protein
MLIRQIVVMYCALVDTFLLVLAMDINPIW